MTSRERWMAAITGEKPDRVPTDFWGTGEVQQNLLRFLGLESMEAAYDRLHIDKPFGVGARYVGPERKPDTDAYGVVSTWVNHGTGRYREAVVNPLAEFETVEEIEASYQWPNPDWWDVSIIPDRLENAGDRPVSIMMAGVYTDYTKLRGMEQAFIDFAMNHDIVEYCMGKMYDLAAERVTRILEVAGSRIDLAWVFNDLGSQEGLLCSPETVRKLFIPGIARLAKIAHEAGATVCMHSDGAIRRAIPDIIAAGVEVLNPIQWRCTGMERRALVADFGQDLTFHGAMDNQETLISNDEAAVRAEVRENIDIFARPGGYILAPCHNLQPVTEPEIIVAMYEEAHEYGRR